MKLFNETEDTIMGIVLGLLLLAPLFLRLPAYETIVVCGAGLLLVLNVLDIRHCIQEFSGYVKACTIAIIMNAADVIINLSLLSKTLPVKIPFITENFVPLLTQQNILIIAVYLIAGNLLYFILHRKLE